MKLRVLLGTVLLGMMALAGCSTGRYFQTPQFNQNLLRENWVSQINLDPVRWTRGASSWFFTGDPNQTERYANRAPIDKAMTIMAVRVPQFTHVCVSGCFQVQIVGAQDHNSVFVLGANDAARQTSVRVSGNTIYVTQLKGNASLGNLRNVIVRIGVRNLRGLSVYAGATVEGRNVTSDGLTVYSNSSNRVLLSGGMNVKKVTQDGVGTISIIGAYTPCAAVFARGAGNVNISGRVGLQYVNNSGNGIVNVIGADSDSLNIDTSGGGLTAIAGYTNLKHVYAKDCSRVYLYWVNSCSLYVTETNNAHVGLAGYVKNVNIDLTGGSRFDGQYLHGGSVYVQTRNKAHANVAADTKIFASASDSSSIYFYGAPNIVSRFVANNGTVLPVWNDSSALPMPAIMPMMKGAEYPPSPMVSNYPSAPPVLKSKYPFAPVRKSGYK